MRIEGVFHVLATPFTRAGELDRPGLRRLLAEVLRAGVDGLTILGVTGEAHKLSAGEAADVVSIVFEEVGEQVPVVVGASRDGTPLAVEATRAAADAGAAAVMVAPPTFLSGGPALSAHYAAIAEVGVPIVLQDFPPITGVKLSPTMIAGLISKVPAITCVKLEDPPTPRRSRQVLDLSEREVTVLGGLSGMYLLDELRHGTHGTMTGFPLPAQLVEMWARWKEGDEAGAEAVYFRLLPLFVADSQPAIGVSLRKHLWRAQGVLNSAAVRGPGIELTELEREGLRKTLGGLGLAASMPPN